MPPLPIINTGHTGFMILCASLVMLMTPGLAFFYGGLVSRKNVNSIMIQSFVSMGWTSVLWFVFGYSMCFGPSIHGIIGNPATHFCLRGINLHSLYNNDATLGIPTFVHVAYQMMFAIITPALITGAFAGRVTFKAYMWFLTAWLIFVYFPFCHMIWHPDGILAKWGVLDFAGGVVVHNTAGIAALASVLFVGRRKETVTIPHSIPLVALGTGLLWFGWYGFNAGSEFKVDSVTCSAFFNTDTAASFAAVTWFVVEWFDTRKPKFLGLLTGAVAGLATVTPAAGYVSPAIAALIGILSGVICYYAVALKNALGWDDALDVWGVHGVGGFIGIIFLGLFASHAWNPNVVSNGLLMGGGTHFFFKQCMAVVISSIWAFVFTYGMLWIIDKLITPVKVGEGVQEMGLDRGLHDEAAYSSL
jgi:ammonium transporter, Amt family